METTTLNEQENKAKEVLRAFKVDNSLDELLENATSEDGLEVLFPLKFENRPCKELNRLHRSTGIVNILSLCRQFKVSMHVILQKIVIVQTTSYLRST